MSIWDKALRLPWSTIFICIYGGLAAILFALHLHYGPSETWSPLLTGTLTGAIIALLQFVWSMAEAGGLKKLKELKVIDVLFTRDDASYYGKLIERAEKDIVVLGTTAKRFLEDFADKESPRPDKKVLLGALERGVKVKILVASRSGLEGDEKSVQKAVDAERLMMDLRRSHSGFSYGYYEHMPTHSIVRIDDSCIVGPCFPTKESRNTPAIRMSIESRLVQSYMEHFESEWNAKTEIL